MADTAAPKLINLALQGGGGQRAQQVGVDACIDEQARPGQGLAARGAA